MRIQTVQMIHVSDWDKLVEETYGRPYSLQQQDGCQSTGLVYLTVPKEEDDDLDMHAEIPEEINGPTMCVEFAAWLERDPAKPLADQEYDWELTMWWERNFYPALQIVANDLYRKGLLEEGEYTINIDW